MWLIISFQSRFFLRVCGFLWLPNIKCSVPTSMAAICHYIAGLHYWFKLSLLYTLGKGPRILNASPYTLIPCGPHIFRCESFIHQVLCGKKAWSKLNSLINHFITVPNRCIVPPINALCSRNRVGDLHIIKYIVITKSSWYLVGSTLNVIVYDPAHRGVHHVYFIIQESI